MSEPVSISRGIADRYASAIFEIAKESGIIAELESNIDDLSVALAQSAELRALIASPVYSRDEQSGAIAALGDKMGLAGVVKNTFALMAQKRRLFVLPQLIEALNALIAEEKGEVTADVTSAKALTAKQVTSLANTLKERIGKDIKINAAVDEELIGGLIVKVGSKMIDTSIRSKLNSLQNAMKEVG